MKHQALKIFSILTITLFTCSCSFIYRPTIQQGNNIKASDLTLLHKGMTSTQIANVLGTPVAINTFSNQNMVYIYTFSARSIYSK